MLPLNWIKSQAGSWLPFQTMDLNSIGDTFGVYVIWHAGNPGRVVRVGQGNVADRLQCHRDDEEICAYAGRGQLYVTWAAVDVFSADGVERYLADTWNPLVGDAWPDCSPIRANSPWG